MITVSLLTSEKTSLASRAELDPTELLSSLTAYQERDSKSGPAWSPFIWLSDRRSSSNALSVSALVYDLDWGKFSKEESELRLKEVLNNLEQLGCAYVIHETFTENSFRLVIPLQSNISANEHSRLHKSICEKLHLEIDESCLDLARVYYLPSKPPESERRTWVESNRPLLDTSHSSEIEQPKESKAVVLDLSSIRENTERLRPEIREKAREALDFKLVIRSGEREVLLHRLTCALTSCLPPEMGWDELREIMLPAVLRMENVDDRGVDYYMTRVKNSFEKSFKFLESRRREREQIQTARQDFMTDDSWKGKLLQQSTRNGPTIKACTYNLDLILENDEAFKGNVRFNELLRRVEYKGALDSQGDKGLELSNWLQSSPYGIDISSEKCGLALLQVAKRNKFNPVEEYLKSLQWDGTCRIQDVLLQYCAAEGNVPYIRSISKKFFIAAVARALEPGIKVDTVLVLHGPMGTKKTSFIEALAGEWYTAMSHRVEDKDTRMQATGAWFVELSEFASVSKSGVEHFRGFITQRSDHMRLPYGREIEEFPRRCVFVGTTNSDMPLSDPEGNRRYWVVSCGNIKLAMIHRLRDQLFAEAVTCFYKAKEEIEQLAAGTITEEGMTCRWWLTKDEQIESDLENSIYEQEDIFIAELKNWLRRPIQDRPQALTPAEALSKVLRWSVQEIRADPGAAVKMGRAMKKLKWDKIVTGEKSLRRRAFRVPQVQEGEPSHE